MSQVRILSDRTDAVIAALRAGVDVAVDEALASMQGDAQSRARVRRGEMKREIKPRKTGVAKGELVGGAAHTIYNERGTRKMAAQPMLGPAAETERVLLPGRVARAVKIATGE